jgi:hypothetical protein
MKIPMFNNVIKEFYGFVGDISSARIYSFEINFRKALRDAYKRGYKVGHRDRFDELVKDNELDAG